MPCSSMSNHLELRTDNQWTGDRDITEYHKVEKDI